MGARDRLERVAAWFGFGDVEEDYYYEEEEEEAVPYGRTAYAGGGGESAPAVRRLGRSDRSSAFGTSLGDLFGRDEPADYDYGRETDSNQPHLRPVPDPRPARVSVLEPSSFNDAQPLADRFKRQQPVILNLQNVDTELSRRMVDFCSGLTYAMDGQIQSVANRVFLLTPRNVEVSAEERKRLAERAFFNQL
ncbi:hypothetical protein BH24ACT21_BH24ACT21_16350 [soil metagenome]|jgi:cell division inhibitor SepF